MTRKRTVVLISGRGSNMAALVAAARAPEYPAEIVAVMANRPDAAGLSFAADLGISTAVVDHKAYRSRSAFDQALDAAIRAHRPDIIALAGFMRLLAEDFVAAWRDRLINIHPSLLPSFRGTDTHARALAAGVKIHGCTVHYVRAEMDDGPIIAQAAVPVRADDTEASLAARVLAAEHRLYPAALALVASGKALVVDGRVIGLPQTDPQAILSVPPMPNL